MQQDMTSVLTVWAKMRRYDETFLRYIAEIVMKIESKMKAQLVHPNEFMSVVGFMATFKLSCNTNQIHEEAAMWALLHFVIWTHTNALNSRMNAMDKFPFIVVPVHNVDDHYRKLMISHLDVVKNLRKKFALNKPLENLVMPFYGTCSRLL